MIVEISEKCQTHASKSKRFENVYRTLFAFHEHHIRIVEFIKNRKNQNTSKKKTNKNIFEKNRENDERCKCTL